MSIQIPEPSLSTGCRTAKAITSRKPAAPQSTPVPTWAPHRSTLMEPRAPGLPAAAGTWARTNMERPINLGRGSERSALVLIGRGVNSESLNSARPASTFLAARAPFTGGHRTRISDAIGISAVSRIVQGINRTDSSLPYLNLVSAHKVQLHPHRELHDPVIWHLGCPKTSQEQFHGLQHGSREVENGTFLRGQLCQM